MKLAASEVQPNQWLFFTMLIKTVFIEDGMVEVTTDRGQVFRLRSDEQVYASDKAPKNRNFGRMNFVGGCPKKSDAD